MADDKFDAADEVTVDFKDGVVVERIMSSTSMLSILRMEKFHTIEAAIRRKPAGVLKLLVASGGVSGRAQFTEFVIAMNSVPLDQSMPKGAAAWKEYRMRISQWLHDYVNSDDFLKEFREELTDEIHENYRQRLPHWPDPPSWSLFSGTKSGISEKVSHLLLKSVNKLDVQRNIRFLISVSGTIWMQDERPNANVFKAKVWGDPRVKLICARFDNKILQKLNGMRLDDLLTAADKQIDVPFAELQEKLVRALT
eukprot:TRINITY_DN42377_c0_g1_i1.p1 TRINITY_DN42377_c0_g1~~TRINITY_DN42377_c0_g1_i1.p1  ORF type:complete len:253 (-),score=62.58 TRINITY_DN42377_c0_g1_i1:124-882(-)